MRATASRWPGRSIAGGLLPFSSGAPAHLQQHHAVLLQRQPRPLAEAVHKGVPDAAVKLAPPHPAGGGGRRAAVSVGSEQRASRSLGSPLTHRIESPTWYSSAAIPAASGEGSPGHEGGRLGSAATLLAIGVT